MFFYGLGRVLNVGGPYGLVRVLRAFFALIEVGLFGKVGLAVLFFTDLLALKTLLLLEPLNPTYGP